MKEALIIGGTSGIGLSIAMNLELYDRIHIVGRVKPSIQLSDNIRFHKLELLNKDYSLLKEFQNIDTLIITAGFGRVALFEEIEEQEIIDLFMVNSIATIRIIKHFYQQLLNDENFYCVIIGSIAGFVSSPFLSVYGASKAAICKFIESVNVELIQHGSSNRILNVSPGLIKGTKFYNTENDINALHPLALEIINNMFQKNDLFIPNYDNTYRNVLKRYTSDFRTFGIQSYKYKQNKR